MFSDIIVALLSILAIYFLAGTGRTLAHALAGTGRAAQIMTADARLAAVIAFWVVFGLVAAWLVAGHVTYAHLRRRGHRGWAVYKGSLRQGVWVGVPLIAGMWWRHRGRHPILAALEILLGLVVITLLVTA